VLIYSFDTSAILNGRRDLLPPETFPTLWGYVEGMIQSGTIRCVEEVLRELSKRDDDAHRWAKGQAGLFLPLDEDLQIATTEILNAHPKLLGKGGGRNAADPFVIALARTCRDGVVVTEERRKNLTSPRIPDVCDALGVRWLSLIGFVREQGWSF
jgi:hypothetical protein